MNKVTFDVFSNMLSMAVELMTDDERNDFYIDLLESGSSCYSPSEGNELCFSIANGLLEFEARGYKHLEPGFDDDPIDLEQLDRESAALSETTENDIKDVFTESEDPQPVKKCRVCGCTQERACPGGCYWVEPDLCSSCVDEQIEISFGYFKYEDESSDRVQILETVGLACDFNSVEEAEAFIHGYATALGLESAFENEAEKYPCQTIEFVVIVNGNYITGLEFFYEGEI